MGSKSWRIVPGVLAAGAVLALGSFAFAYRATHPKRRRAVPIKAGDSLPLENVVFTARDGIRLSAWFLPSGNAAGAVGGVILCHGFPTSREEMLPLARLLHVAGMHVLLFDFRAMGSSEGALCTIGSHEVRDLLGAVDYMVGRSEMAGLQLGAFGNSMGGAVAIMAAAEDPRIAAVATHGAYATLERAISQRCRITFGPAGPMLHRGAIWWGRRFWMTVHPRDVAPVRVIARISPRPVLILHGAHDLTIRRDDARSLYDAAAGPKELVILPRSWHIWVHPRDMNLYKEKALAFFKDNLAN